MVAEVDLPPPPPREVVVDSNAFPLPPVLHFTAGRQGHNLDPKEDRKSASRHRL